MCRNYSSEYKDTGHKYCLPLRLIFFFFLSKWDGNCLSPKKKSLSFYKIDFLVMVYRSFMYGDIFSEWEITRNDYKTNL